MAFYENAVRSSVIAATTFSTGDLHKFVVLDAEGHAILPNTTGNVLPYGVLDSVTVTTSTEKEPVSVVVSGICPVRMAASTLAAGDFIASSTAGLGIAPTTDAYTAGQIVVGSSGAVDRRVSVRLINVGPLSAP